MSATVTAPAANRRNMLGLGGAVAAMSVALAGAQGALALDTVEGQGGPGVGGSGGRDPHVAWLRRFFEVRYLFDNRQPDDPLYDAEPEDDPLWVEYERLMEAVEFTPFNTTEGALARLALMLDQSRMHELGEQEIMHHLLPALRQLGIDTWRRS